MIINTPYWWEAAPRPELPERAIDRLSDTVIIGAGYAGLSAALELARDGRPVQLFDKSRAGEGASSRSGGIGSGNLRISFTSMIQSLGLERAKAMYGEGIAAREDLSRFIEEENIDCHFSPVGRFTGAAHPRHYESLARESDLLREHFGIDAFAVPRSEQRSEIGSDIYHGGAIRNDIGGLHPALLHQGMLERALDAGVAVHARTAVLGIRGESGNFEVLTARGKVKCSHVIACTNGYTDASVKWLRRRIVPVPSMIIATEPLSADLMEQLIPNSRMLGDSNHLHHYFRPSPDGTRILFGGRASGALQVDGQVSHGHLRKKMTQVFPQLENVGLSHVWWGYVAMNLDHLPQMAIRNGIYYPTGFCGSGVVWARWFGRKAAQKVLGDPAGSSAFEGQRFRPIPFYNGNPWFVPGAVLWYKMRDALDL